MNKRLFVHAPRVLRDDPLTGGGVDVGEGVILILGGREILVPDPVVDRQFAGRAPGVLREELDAIGEELGFVEEGDALRGGHAQKEVPDPGTGVAGVAESRGAVQGDQVDVSHLVSPHLRPELEGVAAPLPGGVGRELEDLRGLELRTERRAAHAGEARDIQGGETPGVAGVGGDSRDSVLLVRIDAEGGVEGVALDLVPTHPNLAEHRLRERARPAEHGALTGDEDVAVEVSGNDGPENRRLVTLVLVPAVTNEDRVLAAIARLPIEANVEGVDVVLEDSIADVVGPGRAESTGLPLQGLGRGDVRHRIEIDEPAGDRVETGGTDHLGGHVDAAGGHERVRGESAGQLREVSLPHARGGDGGEVCDRPVAARDLVVAENEELVLLDRPAEGEASDVLIVWALRASGRDVLEGVRVELLVAQEAEDRSLEAVRALLDGGVDDRARRFAELGRVGAGLDAELLERVDRGLDNLGGTLLQVGGAGVVVGPIEGVVVPGAGVAVGVEGGVLAQPRKLAAAWDHAGLQQREFRVSAAEKGQVGELLLIDHVAHFAGLGVEERRLADHRHFFSHGAHIQLEVGLEPFLDVELNAGTHRLLEARHLGGDDVLADLQVREGVLALAVRGFRHLEAAALLDRHHGGAGENAALAVRHRAHDGAGIDLSVGGYGE